jgi:2-hydroxychromene-2-carboxylate isomerase
MKTVDFYFDFSSTNSYFAALLLPEICRRHEATVSWLPLHLAALFRDTGFDVMAMPRPKARYLWRDHQRYAELTGLPFRMPSRFPVKTSIALRCVLAARDLVPGAEARFSQEVFRAYWERDEDISLPAVLGEVARIVGLDSPRLLAASDESKLRDELAAITKRAAERAVFGAPTFFVGAEMFWGKDRLDFVERALRRA